MNGFICCCGDDFGMKGCVVIRDCGVEFDNWVVFIFVIDVVCDFVVVVKMDMLFV